MYEKKEKSEIYVHVEGTHKRERGSYAAQTTFLPLEKPFPSLLHMQKTLSIFIVRFALAPVAS
jgi:hypothetical protein